MDVLELGLAGKVAIVTGGSEGRGRAWVERFAHGGAKVVMGAIRFCRPVIPHMKRRGGGRIINVTTVGGKAPAARSLPTSMSRTAGINLTKSLAHEYAGDKILVNTICLGLVKSAQHERRAKGDLDAHYREIAEKRKLPLGRFGEASEFADLVAFLASERAAYITGTAINFDGGLTAAV